jgi:chromosomal replication initiation ATPase DnaA
MKQIPLEFEGRTALGREDFLVSPANQDVVAWIDRWPDWPGPFMLVVGPVHSGKTHLSHVWAERSGAVTLNAVDLEDLDINALNDLSDNPLVLEDIGEGFNEKKLFHLYNLVKEKRNNMMMTSLKPVSEWNIQLPDLKSRMGALQIVHITEPDDQLFSAVLVKLFSDRQLQVMPEMIQYLVARLERSFEAAHRMVNILDQMSLEEKRNITIPLVRQIMEKEGR